MKNIYSKSNPNIVVATSIAPVNIENQRKTIDTWINAGFEVVSLNCYEEWEKVHSYFPDIKFEVVKRDGRKKYGKPYIYFNDIMEYFKKSDNEICGIINSDIHLVGIDKAFKDFIFRESQNSLVFGHRVDVDSLDDLVGTMYIGHDYFFFDKKLANIYPEEPFFIGQPAWDYWIVFVPILNKVSVKKLINPIAYHIKHPQNWNFETDIKLKRIMLNKYLGDLSKLNSYDCDGHKKIQKMIESYPHKIFYNNCEYRPQILVVYDNCGIIENKSSTYKSILNQTYKNIKIVNLQKNDIDFKNVEEEIIYFIKEGVILEKYFFELMVCLIEKKDYAICGIQLKNNEGTHVQNIYPTNLKSMELEKNRLIEECILYKTNFMKKLNYRSQNLNQFEMGFVGQGLIEINYEEYVKKRMEKIKNKRIYIYAAGKHTENLLERIDFAEFNICGLIDKNKDLQGGNIKGYPVYHVSQMKELHIEYILISSMAFEREIYDELRQIYEENKLIRIYYN